MQQSSLSFLRERWAIRAAAGASLLVAGVLLVVYAALALTWFRQPFAGALPLRTLEIGPAKSLTGADWPLRAAGLREDDQITRVDDTDLTGHAVGERLEAYNDALAAHDDGDTVAITFLRDVQMAPPTGADCLPLPDDPALNQCTLSVRLTTPTLGDLIAYEGIGWAAALGLWLVAGALFLRQRTSVQVALATMLSSGLAIFLAGYFDAVGTHHLAWTWFLGSCFAAGMMAAFALEFPFRFAIVQQMPALALAPTVGGLALGGASLVLYSAPDPALSRTGYGLTLAALLAGGLSLVAGLVFRRSRSASPIARNQSTIVILGVVPALVPVAWWFVALWAGGALNSSLVIFTHLLPLLLPFSAMYAILQFRLLDTDRLVTQAVLYAALLVAVTISYFLVVAGVTVLIGRTMRSTALSPVLIVVAIFGVALAFNPLRAVLQRMIDATYFRARRAFQPHLEKFSRDVTNAIGLEEVNRLIHHALDSALAPAHLLFFVRDVVTHDYRVQPDAVTGGRQTDMTFSSESGLLRYLRDRASVLYLEEGRPLPLEVMSDRARLALLGAPIIVGLRGQKGLNGFLAIGPRKSGAPYVHEDLRFIESLSDQIALAVERAQAVDDLERRVRVQDVLSQVSRALNFAIDFDTLLELVYAQTMRVIQAPCFYIALRDSTTDELFYVFYNEGDDRIVEREGRRWRMGRDLISEIARSQQTLRTDDYVRESLLRDPHTPPHNPSLKAWMGVPLLADTGEGVLGVMVASTVEPTVVFNDEQQDLFWDIGNLAASAIDKLQLFEKTQQRARQLTAINEIANQLASEMGNVSRLLQLITENAVQILNSEAGSLLLVEEETSDLEFRVVVGGAGADLIGTRLPAGTGLAGATVQRGEPIIVNDPARDSRWYGDMRSPAEEQALSAGGNGHDLPREPEAARGFRTGSILSVPLLVSGRAIGVLQVLNKRGGGIFVPEDADMLATFAGQAAIAIENARLFDMTDQQLALRVQELDTMQRIDQELNRTLNLERVVDITMDWALRKSGAAAGALFIRDYERGVLRLLASYGYPEDTPYYRDTPDREFLDDQGALGRAVRSGRPSLNTELSMDDHYVETLPGCVTQMTVPLFSATRVIGVIILESDREGELGLLDLDFVARLAEHATPAIVNAQLFSELQRANVAKSEFVSFVAHELKNPMTSMKGYTDLLLKGVVGPVNEQQSDFLHTIFNNVARMETLVSDLNDLTKQQTDNLRLELGNVNFRNVVMETLRAQQRMIEDKAQELVLDLPDDLPFVRGDQNRLIQVMTNFVSNASKYTPPNGTITIHAEAARNQWDPQGPPEVIHCTVSDTGIGMSGEDLRQLFTPYFRSENPLTREQPGTGLGLTITRGLIALHGGTVWVESTLDVGTTFHFTLPVAARQERAPVRARG